MFDSKRKVKLDAKVVVHYEMGVQIGNVQEMSSLNQENNGGDRNLP